MIKLALRWRPRSPVDILVRNHADKVVHSIEQPSVLECAVVSCVCVFADVYIRIKWVEVVGEERVEKYIIQVSVVSNVSVISTKHCHSL